MPEYKEPPCEQIEENKLGKGGNGAVYISNDPKLACKVFSVEKDLLEEKKKKRYARFCNEILTQKELSGKMEGVLPVIDYCFPQDMSNERPAWFLMPKARKFTVYDDKSFEDKICDLIELGRIISSLHSYGMAHRDIKPDNILRYRNRLHLSDYGLVWVDGKSDLTNSPERMGPIKIMPPELESCEDINECNYRKSDVYLFAKVAWMYIKSDNNGFKGPYNRGSKQIYLNRESYNCKSLEPFHKMMSNATIDEWSKRIDISDCIEYLQKQLVVARGDANETEVERYILQENLAFFDQTVQPKVKVYSGREEIEALLRSVIPWIEVCFDDGLESHKMRPSRYRYLTDEVIAFYEERPDGTSRRTFLRVARVEKSEVKIDLILGPFERKNIERYWKDHDILIGKESRATIDLSACGFFANLYGD